MKKKCALLYWLVICSVICSFSGNTAIAAETGPFKVGVILSVTGVAGPFGTGQRDAIESLVDKVNKSGGINGRLVEIFIEDDQSQPTNANIAVAKLIKDKKVHAVVGSTLTSSTKAMIPTMEKYKIPNVTLGAGIELARPTKEWVFQNAPSDEALAPEMLKFGTKKMGAKKAALLYAADPHGKLGAEKITGEAAQYGQDIVAAEEFDPNATSMVTQLTKINRLAPDVLYVYATAERAGIIAKNIKQLGMKIPIVASHGVPMPRFITVAGDATDGWIMFTQKASIGSSIDPSDPWRARYDEFVQTTRAWNPSSACDTFSANAWDGMSILLKAFQTAGDDGEKIKNALEQMEHKGVNGNYRFSKDNHAGFDASDEITVVVKDGDFVLYDLNQ